MKIVFLLEEPSMKETLDILLPNVLPPEVSFQTIRHEGKNDLEQSIPRKLRAWREPGVRFVVVRDNDGGDCIALKSRLTNLCEASGRPDTLVRIVCQELECWFLGDLAAVEKAYNMHGLARQQTKMKYRRPDKMGNSPDTLCELTKDCGKISRAKAIAPHIDIRNNKSKSFNVFVSGIQRIASHPSTSFQAGQLL